MLLGILRTAPRSLFVCGALAAAGIACGEDTPRDATLGSYLSMGEPRQASDALTVCADGETVAGIDVSKWQGTINWPLVAADGVDLAFIRVSDGLDYPDAKFATNWAAAKDNGIRRGAYQFFRSDEDPIDQADYLLETMGALEPGDMPPVIDVESTDSQTPATIAARVGDWIDHVEGALGVKPIIYTGKYFWQDNVQSTAFSTYPLWIPHWGAACPNLPTQWSDWTYWQYSATGSVDGISGDVDMNYFNGSATALSDFSFAPGCGDGFCNGGETGSTCASDCPTCAEVPAAGGIIDESSECFFGGGNPAYLRAVTTDGYDGGLFWTNTWVSTSPGNYGIWSLRIAEAGLYEIEAYVDADFGEWDDVPYDIHAGGVTETWYVDQSAASGWVTVGEVELEAGDGQWVRVDDNVASGGTSGVKIVFDALRLTRLDVPVEPGPDSGPVGGDDGGPSGGDSGANGDSDSGGNPGEPRGGDPTPGGGSGATGPTGGGGTGSGAEDNPDHADDKLGRLPERGCQQSGVPQLAVLLGVTGILVTRRRRT